MQIRFKKKTKILDVGITVIAGMLSVCFMLYGVSNFGLSEGAFELILDLFYIACFVMIWMYLFNRLHPKQFNYWCTLCVGITVLLRDILFSPELTSYPIRLTCLTLSVWLLLMLTYFYARKEWESYTKLNLWMIFIVDVVIAILYHYDISCLEHIDKYTNFLLTEIWIRPTITYGLVACFVTEAKMKEQT